MGIITGIEWTMLNRDQLNEGDLPENIMVKFDDPDKAKQISFLDKVGDSIRIKAHITRRMFPLILCWAVTIHKTQGLTIEKAVVSLMG